VRLAEAWGITVCGYTHAQQTNIYTHPERIIFDKTPA
jgi:formate dehydrogenase assembly factor FdhD